MPLTAYTNFNAKYKLANTAPSDPEGAELAIFIADYEAKYLTDMLGYKLAQDLITAIGEDGGFVGPVDQKWLALKVGAEFTDKHGRLNKWPGFMNTQDLSPIVPFIFREWQISRQTYSSGSGEKVVLTENSEPTGVTNKIVKAWNDMVELNLILDDFLTQNKADYPDYPGVYGVLGEYGNIKYFKRINAFGV